MTQLIAEAETVFSKCWDALLPEQIIYIDDLQHNVEAARRIGMYAIRFSDPVSLREELVMLGLLRSEHESNTLKR